MVARVNALTPSSPAESDAQELHMQKRGRGRPTDNRFSFISEYSFTAIGFYLTAQQKATLDSMSIEQRSEFMHEALARREAGLDMHQVVADRTTVASAVAGPNPRRDSYSEQECRASVNWWELLDRLEAGEDYWDLAVDLSGNWVTCAVGNQCAALPRHDYGEPKDPRLAELGERFYQDVTKRRLLSARATLEAIESTTFRIMQEGDPEHV